MFDRAAILREAHAATRRRLVLPALRRPVRCRADFVGAEGRHRAIFAGRLRDAWHMALSVAAAAALEASLPPVDAATLAEADAIRANAWCEPITAAGNARMAAAHLAVSALLEGARLAA